MERDQTPPPPPLGATTQCPREVETIAEQVEETCKRGVIKGLGCVEK